MKSENLLLSAAFLVGCHAVAPSGASPPSNVGVVEPSGPAGETLEFSPGRVSAPEAQETPTSVAANRAAESGVSIGTTFFFPYIGEGWSVENHADGQGVTLVRGEETISLRPCAGLISGADSCVRVDVTCSPAVPAAVCQEVKDGAFIQ